MVMPTSPSDPPLPGASDPPPPYTQNPTTNTTSQAPPQNTSNLQVPNNQRVRNGIPPDARRSMEDEARSLPLGWIRQFDPTTAHQFFIDTTASPPRSIWHHPYDDDQYMSSLSSSERARIEKLHEAPSHADINAETSGEDSDIEHQLPPRQGNNADEPKGVKKYTRKMKDKLTSSTHHERESFRQQRAREEQAAYERHRVIRAAMVKAIQTGQPQYLGKNKEGKGVYIDPPSNRGGAYSGGYPGSLGYGGTGYGWGGPPMVGGVGNGVMMRPGIGYGGRPGYGRRPGYGYGGGMGLPLMGGLVGGAMLGGALF